MRSVVMDTGATRGMDWGVGAMRGAVVDAGATRGMAIVSEVPAAEEG
jgi:hypothetical protein